MPSIEDHIRKAMEEGQFDDLPGKGKPLRLDENPLEDPEWRMAYHVLKNGGFTLPWIETRQEILTELEQQRQGLRRAWDWRNRAQAQGESLTAVEAEWRRAREAFRQALERLNRRIRDFNLQVPSDRFQVRRVNIEAEIEAATRQDEAG